VFDPYVYDGTNILKNKFLIKDEKILNELESTLVNLNLIKLLNDNTEIYNISYLNEIHKTLFGDLYEWAGDFRTINIFKSEIILNGLSVEYSNYKDISKQVRLLESNLFPKLTDTKSLNDLKKITIESMIQLWKIHPFREGNTRTILTFFNLILRNRNIDFDHELLKKHAAYFRNALVMANIDEYSEINHIDKIMNDAIKLNDTNNYEKVNDDYSVIGDTDLKSYVYLPHYVKE
jgi:cell filamentation protein